MKKQQAIKKLIDFISEDSPLHWLYAGEDYHDAILAAEDSLNALYGYDSIKDVAKALKFAEKL